MKPKLARRWLVRNQWKNAKRDHVSGFMKTCLRIIRENAKVSKASRRVFNNLVLKTYHI